jgi:hypothetical protein
MSGYVRHPSEAECTNQILRRNQVYESISDVNPSLGLKLSSNANHLSLPEIVKLGSNRDPKNPLHGEIWRFENGDI